MQLPPTASTEEIAVNSARFFGPMPPVGTNFTPPNGPASALIAGAPPEVCAGKNFTACRPAASAAWISVAVTVPGSGSTPRSEEHTSELQSRGHLVCRLLLEKKR